MQEVVLATFLQPQNIDIFYFDFNTSLMIHCRRVTGCVQLVSISQSDWGPYSTLLNS